MSRCDVQMVDGQRLIVAMADRLALEATTGIEPVYAVLQTAPWTTRARRHRRTTWLPREDSNLGSRIQSPLSYH
jgi:hypothetical protein